MRTFLPIGSTFGKSAWYGVWPSTTTWRRCCDLAGGEEAARARASTKLTAAKFSVVPKIVERLRPLAARSRSALRLLPARRAEPDVDDVDRRAVALDRARVSSVRFGPLHQLLRTSVPDDEAERAELLRRRSCSGPSSRIESRSDSSKPRISDVMPTIEVMPMTTPSTVSAERILFVRSVSNDIADDFAEQAGADAAIGLLAPQRFDRIERRGAHRRIQAEEQADDRRDADARARPTRPATAAGSGVSCADRRAPARSRAPCRRCRRTSTA